MHIYSNLMNLGTYNIYLQYSKRISTTIIVPVQKILLNLNASDWH